VEIRYDTEMDKRWPQKYLAQIAVTKKPVQHSRIIASHRAIPTRRWARTNTRLCRGWVKRLNTVRSREVDVS
jgi:hypothetical protein